MIHMTIQQLSSYLDAELASDSMERVGIHLSSCAECTSKFVAIEQQANRISGALGHDPGDLLSEQFERMVDERILNGKRRAAPRPTTVRALPPLPEAPPVATPRVPALPYSGEPVREEVPVLSSAGEGMRRTAEAVATSVRSFTTPRRREDDRFRRWPVGWAAALILVVIVAGAGVVASRTGRLPSWSGLPPLQLSSMATRGAPESTAAGAPAPPPAAAASWAVAPDTEQESATVESPQTPAPEPTTAPAPETTAMSSELPAGDDSFESPGEEDPPITARGPGVATTTLRGDELLSSGSAPSAPPAQVTPSPMRESPAATPSRALTPAEAARQISERAANDPSALSYEAAAMAWEAALGSLHGDAYQEGRWRIAEARYRAWQMDPEEGQRASRATTAIRAYLIAAPPGGERDQARTWLNVIRESGFRYIDSPR